MQAIIVPLEEYTMNNTQGEELLSLE
jgi:hypothetical protein